MNSDDMLKLFQRPMTPRPEAIAKAEKILNERDKLALQQAQDKRDRKNAFRLRVFQDNERTK